MWVTALPPSPSLSENIAVADRDPQAAAFRNAHLPDGLIRLDQVDGGLRRLRHEAEETATPAMAVRVGNLDRDIRVLGRSGAWWSST